MSTEASGSPAVWTASKSLIAAHPVGFAIVGGIVVGVAAYYAMKFFSGKKEEAAAAS